MRLHLGSCLLPAREADVIFEGYPIRFCLRALEEHHLLICAVVDVHERQVNNQPPVNRLGTVKGRAPRGLLSSRIPGFHENFPFPRTEHQAPGMQRSRWEGSKREQRTGVVRISSTPNFSRPLRSSKRFASRTKGRKTFRQKWNSASPQQPLRL